MKPITGKPDDNGEGDSVIGPRRKRRGTSAGVGAFLKETLQGAAGRPWARITVLGVAGLLIGYVMATRVVFPAPPAPTDLVPVPDLEGQTLAEVEGNLADIGLVIGAVDSVKHPTFADGGVFGQSPLPGQWARAGAEVRLTLSSGRQEIRVPDLEGDPLDQAQTLLQAAGFTIEIDSVESSAPRGNVVAMEPSAGEQVEIPATLRLEVSLGPPMVAVPRLIGLTEEEATEALEGLGLLVSDVEVRFRFGLDQGKVIEQEPAPGREIEEGAGVRLVVGRRARDGGN